MINVGLATMDAMIEVTIATCCGLLFFYFFYFRNHHSKSKIILILGGLSAIFLWQGLLIITAEIYQFIIHGSQVDENEVYRGALISIPVMVSLSVIEWMINSFGSKSNNKINSIKSNSRAEISVEQQLKRNDLLVLFVIAVGALIYVITSNFDEFLSLIGQGKVRKQVETKETPIFMRENDKKYRSTVGDIQASVSINKSFVIESCTFCFDGDCSHSTALSEIRISEEKILLFGKRADGVTLIFEYPDSVSGMICSIVPYKNFSFFCSSSNTSSTDRSRVSRYEDISFDGISTLTSRTLFSSTIIGENIVSSRSESSKNCKIRMP